jgi:peptidoglycan/xylan/chitin deacetylase (PgdA/CDA1 family)
MKSYPGLNIVMYHYILQNNKFLNYKLNSLNVDDFHDQIKRISKNNKIITPEEFRFKLNKQYKFKNEFILTFDDGYKCHYKIVKKILDIYKIKGFFYPTCYPYVNKNLLNINKIHLILSNEKNTRNIIEFIYSYLKKKHIKIYKKINQTKNKIIKFNSYDNVEIKIIKGLLQSFLPQIIASEIIDTLFRKIVKIPEEFFFDKFYLNFREIINLDKEKHEIGLHGFNHNRYQYLTTENQNLDIKRSIKFWEKILKNKSKWSICYPFGSYNNMTLKCVSKNKIDFALTTKKGSNTNLNKNLLTLKRWDTNDFL